MFDMNVFRNIPYLKHYLQEKFHVLPMFVTGAVLKLRCYSYFLEP